MAGKGIWGNDDPGHIRATDRITDRERPRGRRAAEGGIGRVWRIEQVFDQIGLLKWISQALGVGIDDWMGEAMIGIEIILSEWKK